MRLVCPNCDAEYEVDDAAIPRTGRDVQCSNCGHAWFQSHSEAEDEQADELRAQGSLVEAMTEGGVGTEASGLSRHDAEDEAWAGASSSSGIVAEAVKPAADPIVPASLETASVTRTIDESVLAVLREEAAREVAARRAETPPLETQTEMPFAYRVASDAAAARPAVANAAVATPTVRISKAEPAAKAEAPAEVQPNRLRRDLLPTIEEINSTLRASSGRPGEEEESLIATEAAQAARSRFGSGFVTLVLLAVILLAIYVLAPVIAEKVPSLAGALSTYVAAVDAARIWLDVQIRTLIDMLRGLEGAAQG